MNKLAIFTLLSLIFMSAASVAVPIISVSKTQIEESPRLGAENFQAKFNLTASENVSNINLYSFLLPFNVNFYPNNISYLNSSSIEITANATLPLNLPGGTYTGIILVSTGNAGNIVLNTTVNILLNFTWDVNYSQNVNTTSLSVGFASPVSIINNKNDVIKLSVISTKDEWLFYEKNVSIAANSTRLFFIGYGVPANATPRVYPVVLTFLNSQLLPQFKTANLNITVLDNTPPLVSCSIPNSTFINSILTINCEAYDDFNVSLVRANIEGKNEILNLVANKTSDRTWVFIYNASSRGDVNFVVLAYDNSGNVNYVRKSIKVTLYDVLQITNRPDIGISKVAFSASAKILKSTAPVQINVTLTEFSGYVDAIWIEDELRNKFYFNTSAISDTIKVAGFADLYLYTNSSSITQYSGKLKISAPEFVVLDDPEIIFNGEFRLWNVQKAYETNKLTFPFYCIPEDTGVYETSKIKCIEEFPIDTPVEKITVAMTPTTFENALSDKDREITNYKALLFNANSKVGLLFFILLMMGAWLMYVYKFRDRMLWLKWFRGG